MIREKKKKKDKEKMLARIIIEEPGRKTGPVLQPDSFGFELVHQVQNTCYILSKCKIFKKQSNFEWVKSTRVKHMIMELD